MKILPPYLLFLGDVEDPLSVKTSRGVAQWRPELCMGEFALPGCTVSLGLEPLTPQQARERGVKTLILGLANSGGVIRECWVPAICQALECGLDVASGLHQKLVDIPEVKKLAAELGRNIVDVRYPNRTFHVGSGKKRSGKRLLTVGTDCAVGKMYASLALHKGIQNQGLNSDFRATGQTGILISGEGVPVDAVVSDFISGSIEELTPDNSPDHWDIIEGQGSLFHPSFAGVSLGLLHGAQADVIIMCHEVGRQSMRGVPEYELPDIGACIELNLELGARTNPDIKLGGIALNSSALPADEAETLCQQLAERHGVPCFDPVRHSTGPVVDFIQALDSISQR